MLHLCHSWDDSGGNAVRALVTDQQNRVRPLPSPWKPCMAAMPPGAAHDEALCTGRASILCGSSGVAAAAVEAPHPRCQHAQTVSAAVGASRQAAAAAAVARRWRRHACASTYRPATATSPAAKRRACTLAQASNTWLSIHVCISLSSVPAAQSNLAMLALNCTCGWVSRYALKLEGVCWF